MYSVERRTGQRVFYANFDLTPEVMNYPRRLIAIGLKLMKEDKRAIFSAAHAQHVVEFPAWASTAPRTEVGQTPYPHTQGIV